MTKRFAIEFSTGSKQEFDAFRAFEKRRVLDDVERKLTTGPDSPTKDKKCLGDQEAANFDYSPPLWELRVGEFRVFYEIDATTNVVYILAVRKKPPDKTTSEVLNETDGN